MKTISILLLMMAVALPTVKFAPLHVIVDYFNSGNLIFLLFVATLSFNVMDAQAIGRDKGLCIWSLFLSLLKTLEQYVGMNTNNNHHSMIASSLTSGGSTKILEDNELNLFSSLNSSGAGSNLTGVKSLSSESDTSEKTPDSDLNQNIISEAKNSKQQFFSLVNAKDTGEDTDNKYILVRRWQNSKKPLTAEFLNSLLHDHMTRVTPDLLKYFNSMNENSWSIGSDLPFTDESRLEIRKFVGSTEPKSNIIVSGVYRFIRKDTGELLYLGSSKHLGARGPSYLVPSRQKGILGRWGKYVRSNPTLEGCRLEFNILPKQFEEFYVAMEQFYFLTSNPTFNDLLVASSGGGGKSPEMLEAHKLANKMAQGRFLHVYSEDRTTRLATYYSARDAAKELGINHNSIEKSLIKNNNVKGIFFSSLELDNALDNFKTSAEIKLLMDNESKGGLKRMPVTVKTVETGLIVNYPSMYAASMAVGRGRSSDSLIRDYVMKDKPFKSKDGLTYMIEYDNKEDLMKVSERLELAKLNRKSK